jgi:hypothetical protein
MRAVVGGLRAWGPPMPVPKRGGAIRGMPRFRFREPTCLRCFPFIRVRNSPRVLECWSSCSCRGPWVGVGAWSISDDHLLVPGHHIPSQPCFAGPSSRGRRRSITLSHRWTHRMTETRWIRDAGHVLLIWRSPVLFWAPEEFSSALRLVCSLFAGAELEATLLSRGERCRRSLDICYERPGNAWSPAKEDTFGRCGGEIWYRTDVAYYVCLNY